MSDVQNVTKFENLPNEILLDCFEYLQASDVFYSFDQLNNRFHQLIYTLPWHLNFQDVQKSVFDQLCQTMLGNPEIQRRIHSLRLSNKDTHGQIEAFLSRFSLEQFSHLRSLTLIDVKDNNMARLKQILPLLSQLTCFRLVDSEINNEELESAVPIDNLKTLSLSSSLRCIRKMIPIKNLTISTLSLRKLCRLLRYTPLIQYLNISRIEKKFSHSQYRQSSFVDYRPVHLKHLIMTDFQSDFDDLTDFFKYTPTLQNFTICSCTDINMVHAPRWEELITSLLSDLKSFNFKFAINDRIKTSSLMKIFEQFHTDFWLKEHQWYTECSMKKYFTVIYTIPYLTESTQISLQSKRHRNKLINNFHTFDLVTDLALSADELIEHGDYYFPNVTSLVITGSLTIRNEDGERRFIESLKSLMNLSKMKHLEIPFRCHTERPELLLEIFKLAPQLSSLRIERCFFDLVLTDHQSCRYMNQRIQKLDISKHSLHGCQMFEENSSFYELFPNIEQLTIRIKTAEDLFLLVNQFSKLSSFNVIFRSTDYPQCLDDFKLKASEQNALFYEDVKYFFNAFVIAFSVWTSGNSMKA